MATKPFVCCKRRQISISPCLMSWYQGLTDLKFAAEFRETNERIGIIFLTAKVQEQDKVYALSVGADDHVSKPFIRRS